MESILCNLLPVQFCNFLINDFLVYVPTGGDNRRFKHLQHFYACELLLLGRIFAQSAWGVERLDIVLRETNNESSEVFDIIKPGQRVKIKGYRK